MTTCYPDTMKVKRDIQRRIEDYVIKYCETLEENFKQYSIRSYKRNIDNPTRFPEVINHIMKSNFKKLKMVQQIYINLIIKLVKNI